MDAKPTPVAKPVTPEEVEAIRVRVYDALAAAKARSLASGKPLLILVGEAHNSPDSALLETIIYQEARAMGVRDVALEVPAKQDAQSIKASMQKADISRGNMIGHSLMYQQAGFNTDTIHYADGRHDMALSDLKAYKSFGGVNAALLKSLAARNETIAANLTEIPRDTLMITGAMHLAGLNRRMNNHDTHEVISFDTTETSRSQNKNKNASNVVHTLKLKGDARLLTDDQLIVLGMGAEEGGRFIHWAESNGRKTPDAEIAAANKNAAERLKKNPKDIRALGVRADALYQLGQDNEAGKALARLNVSCEDVKHGAKKTACNEASKLLSHGASSLMASYSTALTTSMFSELGKLQIRTNTITITNASAPTPPSPGKPLHRER